MKFPEVALQEQAFNEISSDCEVNCPLWRENILVFAIEEETVLLYFFCDDSPDPTCFETGFHFGHQSMQLNFSEYIVKQLLRKYPQ